MIPLLIQLTNSAITVSCGHQDQDSWPREISTADDSAVQDYAVAHEALSLLGTKLPPARESAAAALEEAAGQRLELSYAAQAAVGAAAVVIGVVVVGGWYWRRRRRLQAA